jgi:hypothetical protein
MMLRRRHPTGWRAVDPRARDTVGCQGNRAADYFRDTCAPASAKQRSIETIAPALQIGPIAPPDRLELLVSLQ